MNDVQAAKLHLKELEAQFPVKFYLVGGIVRDTFLDRESHDIDVLATGLPEQELIDALSKFGRVERTGAVFGVIRYYPRGKVAPPLEIALPRKEISTGTHHKDFTVEFDHTLPVEQDLLRRDFTANAIAVAINNNHIIDPFHGIDDIQHGILRMTNNSSAQDDPLRILRGLRFISQLGFDLDDDTRRQIVDNVALLDTISPERIQEELLKLVCGKFVAKSLFIAAEVGAVAVILPELAKGIGCGQNKYHDFDVFEHIVRVVAETPTNDPIVKLAALFHDIAKPYVKWIGLDGEAHFYKRDPKKRLFRQKPLIAGNHEVVGGDMTREIMRRLKFSKHNTDRVAFLVEEHMFNQGPGLGARAGRRFLARLAHSPGGVEENVKALFDLREGDCRGGKTRDSEAVEATVEINRQFESTILKILASDTAFKVTDLAVDGHDLMAVGLKGEEIGQTLKELLEIVLDEPELNDCETLMQIVERNQVGIG